MAHLIIEEITFGSGISEFINFPHDLYKDDKNYVPEIYIGQKDMMNPNKFPFHKYGKVKYFLAKKDGKIVGRIAAIHNPNYNKHHHCKVGFFGFFDFIEDQEVASSLLDKAKDYASTNGNEFLMGPTNFTTNETAGTLVEGFDSPPKIMMTYNKPYYGQLMENYGLKKEMDLYAYMIYTSKVSEKSLRIASAVEDRLKAKGITIRNVNLKDINNEAKRIQKIYNDAWEENWGFVPFTDDEFEYLKNDLKMLLDPSFAYIAEKNGEPIGFGLTLPDINEVLIKNKRGKLFPFGIFRLLFGKSKTKYVRVLALGVISEYRKMGIEALFFAKNIKTAKEKGLLGGEASWVLESNEAMRAAADHLNGEKYKTYRLYKTEI
ncbi:MAG: GNAT family N-acetyltransferase [Saprospiraceae bacterium]|nr:GNAT family N-acetyltransferase [Saprospiraceae bacterium]